MAAPVDRHRVRRCGVCGERRPIRKAAEGEQPDQCEACWRRNPASHRQCSVCGELRRAAARSASGEAVCGRCHARAQPEERCDGCGQVRRLRRRGAGGGTKLCQVCARKRTPARACGRCGQVTRIVARESEAGGRDLCESCYDHSRRQRCGRCGKLKRPRVAAREGALAICASCYRWPTAICSVCGERRPCMFASSDAPVCRPCRRAYAARLCSLCGERRELEWRTPIGSVCGRCRSRHLRAKAPCQSCGRSCRPATFDPGRVLCADCAGVERYHLCTLCGAEDEHYDQGLCARCSLARRLRSLAADGAPDAVVALGPYLRALAGSPRPRTALLWLRLSPAYEILVRLARGELELSHEALDELVGEPPSALAFLRAALVEHGVLPARPEPVARLARWAQVQLGVLSESEDRGHLRAYATWKVQRDLARRGARGTLTPATATVSRADLLRAIELTRWLHDRNLALGDLRQDLLERWLLDGGSHRERITGFISWLRKTKVIGRLSVPPRARLTPIAGLEDRARLALLRRLLQDEDLELHDRVAGSLVLLYAQPLTRITSLRRDAVDQDNGRVYLALGAHPAPLPAPLDTLVLRLRDTPPRLASTAATNPSQWLLPGRKLGHPISASVISRRLTTLGVPAVAARTGALDHLLHSVPPVVLAELVGISATTAERRSARAGADYALFGSVESSCARPGQAGKRPTRTGSALRGRRAARSPTLLLCAKAIARAPGTGASGSRREE
ncbi:MAG: hypothetical protein LC777_01995 [Actinobacteria bacterium]|nr:hypothetical protein [Actinomycetota bacterium]